MNIVSGSETRPGIQSSPDCPGFSECVKSVKPGYWDKSYRNCNRGIILYVILNINLMAQNIAKSLFEMERIDVRIEHALEFSIKIVLSILKIGFEPGFVAFPV